MKIVSITEVQPRTVYALKTTTKTFISDGLAHHNCVGCNVFLRGNYDKYMVYMLDTVGEKRVRELAGLKKQLIKSSVNDYLEIFEKYTKKLEELLS